MKRGHGLLLAAFGVMALTGCGGDKPAADEAAKDAAGTPSTGAVAAAEAAALEAGPRASQTLKYDGNLADVGERLFDELTCTACHTLGQADDAPDLMGVTQRRAEAWLMRQITDPEWMAAHDPITQGLVEQWGMEMTDLGVSEADARAILNYLERESR
jgi:hypothetical protein